MDNYFADPRLQQAQTNYQNAQQAANASAEADLSLPTQLKEALNQKFSTNNPLIQEREGALKGYLNSIPESQAAVLPENNNGVILSPIHQADLITKTQSAKLAPLTTLNYILGLATGGIGDVIDSASAAHQKQTVGKQNKATLARTVYSDLLNELSTKAEMAFKERQFQENIRQFNVEQGNKKLGSLEDQQSLAALQRDVQRGTTFKELYNRFASVLPEWQIREIYNQGPVARKYGPAKEKSADLISGFANVKKGKLNDQEDLTNFQSFSAGLQELKGQYKGLNVLDKGLALIPGAGRLNPKISALEAKKTILGYDLARMRDKGVLNKQDVQYAMDSLGQIAATDASALAKIEEVEKYINRKLGLDDGKGSDKDPLGLF